jgi:hypothetical protein
MLPTESLHKRTVGLNTFVYNNCFSKHNHKIFKKYNRVENTIWDLDFEFQVTLIDFSGFRLKCWYASGMELEG